MRVRVDIGEVGEIEEERGREREESDGRTSRSRMASVIAGEVKVEEKRKEMSEVEGGTDEDDDGDRSVEEEESSEDDEEVIPLSQMIDALDLGL